MDVYLAAVERISAEDRAHGLGTAGAYQAGEAEDLSAVCLEADVVEHAAFFQVLGLEEALALGAEFLRELVLQRTANHACNQVVVVRIADVFRPNILAVANDGNAVAQLEQLFQLVRYKDDADTAIAQLAAGFHQLLNLFFTKRGGRLVHNNHFCVNQNRLGDLDHLLNAHTKVACRLGGVNILAQGKHNFLGLLVHSRVVKQATLFDPLVDKNIVGNTEQLLNIQFLINTCDAGGSRIVRVLEVLLHAVDEDLAFVRLVHARQNLDQRGFTRAVLADQAENLTGLYRQVHVLQSHNARKPLGCVFQLYYVFTHCIITFSSPRWGIGANLGRGRSRHGQPYLRYTRPAPAMKRRVS